MALRALPHGAEPTRAEERVVHTDRRARLRLVWQLEVVGAAAGELIRDAKGVPSHNAEGEPGIADEDQITLAGTDVLEKRKSCGAK